MSASLPVHRTGPGYKRGRDGMPLRAHGDRKYRSSTLLGGAAEWDALRVEHRQVAAGAHNALTSKCTETQLELAGPLECLHLYLPATLLEQSAIADYDVDPNRTQLAYAGGLADPVLAHIGSAMHGLLRRGSKPSDRIFADGMRTALAAHLIGNYTVDRRQPPRRAPSLDAKRLKRVLDFIEARLASDISLDDLAAEACLSPFHFSRLFREVSALSKRSTPARRARARRNVRTTAISAHSFARSDNTPALYCHKHACHVLADLWTRTCPRHLRSRP